MRIDRFVQMTVVTALTAVAPSGAAGQQLDWQAHVTQAELRGESGMVPGEIERALAGDPKNSTLLGVRAQWLDARRHPATPKAYEDYLTAPGLSRVERDRVLRRIAALELISGDREAAARRLASLTTPAGLSAPAATPKVPSGEVLIPGPMSGFARMAALSPELPPNEVLAALARNIVTGGYQAMGGNQGLEQTEYLKLILRYISQAREIEALAGASRVLRIAQCESTQTGELLRILGFRMRGGCGSEVVLETVNASRAFLTIDSGFPLAELEQALRSNRLFEIDYKPTRVTVLYGPEYWLSS
ncbi:MAG TPA: hypothetical protein PLZ95_01115, partial [Bryobacteraceae bacterium]|nr:hypothetical protein [Bryobacteraceae bacterium]